MEHCTRLPLFSFSRLYLQKTLTITQYTHVHIQWDFLRRQRLMNELGESLFGRQCSIIRVLRFFLLRNSFLLVKSGMDISIHGLGHSFSKPASTAKGKYTRAVRMCKVNQKNVGGIRCP